MKHIDNAYKLRPIIEKAMQSIDGNEALAAKMLYPTFDSVVGKSVEQGFKFTYGDKLWSVAQSKLTIEKHRHPDIGTESLYSKVCETHSGTLEDPIPYDGNMALENGKYYIQSGVIYLCNRDTINPVYQPLSELVGLYLEIA